MHKQLDDIDLEIMAALQADGRLSNVDLAKHVGLTPTPCLERVKRLEREGVIEGYTARINPQAIDRGLLVFVEVTTESAAVVENERFRAAVNQLPDVQECHMVGGGFDYLIKLRVADMAAYRDLYSGGLAELPGVREMQTYFVIDEFKHTTELPLKPSHSTHSAPNNATTNK